MNSEPAPARDAWAVRLGDVRLEYRHRKVLDGVALCLSTGGMLGLIGPDGVGKSSLLALIAGARVPQSGSIEVLGGNIADARHRMRVCPRIAYMPQGLGRNLYPTLSVFENIDFFARLFAQPARERAARIAALTARTGLTAFADRPAGQLSGGMKQKLGLCCALVHDPDLLILDEPTTGIDPLSRQQFWRLIAGIRAQRPDMSVMVATAYMDEALRFDALAVMDAGRILARDTPAALLARTGSTSLESAFMALSPTGQKAEAARESPAPEAVAESREIAIEARGLTLRFGAFVAVDDVSFRIRRGEIFGFIGSNGCGKTTTMKMLTGLLPPSAGEARLFGQRLDAGALAVRRRVGYMSQSFSLYSELTVRRNLALHAQLFGLPSAVIPGRIADMLARFDLQDAADRLPDDLPLGHRQRLSLAVAMIHGPDVLILDEPTAGVAPVSRDRFWTILAELSRRDGVTIFMSTHFMNEAARCDRVALMHAGHVLAIDAPAALVAARAAATLEDAFVGYLADASEPAADLPAEAANTLPAPGAGDAAGARRRPEISGFHPGRTASYARREALELARDPIRLTLALLGSLVLMLVVSSGMNFDVTHLNFAVLDRDHTPLSRDYAAQIAGSRYFAEKPPLADYRALDRRMQSGRLSLAIEIPPGFARDVRRGRPAAVSAWIDGAMPSRAEIVRGDVSGLHAHWLAEYARRHGAAAAKSAAVVETRYRYNPDVRSLVAMVPADIALLLMLIPAMLASLSVVREKELGSIINFYVTPTRRIEFILGKQAPYVALAMLNFGLLTAFGTLVLGVPFKGSLIALTAAAFVYTCCTTAIGLLISTFMRSQIAAIFGTIVLTILPALTFSGMNDPVSSLRGPGRVIGAVYPMSHFLTIVRGTFSKALGFAALGHAFVALLVTAPILIALAAALLRKQAR